MHWTLPRTTLDLRERACVMGILNATPDSFSDGGRFLRSADAVAHALCLLREGATIIDIGGESTRPGAQPVGEQEELRRVLPVVEGVLAEAPAAILSIDTSKAGVAREALRRGVSIVNDVTALRADPEMAGVVAEFRAGVVLMHMQGDPRTMQAAPRYGDVVTEVHGFLEERYRRALQVGIGAERIALDAGIGFGKTYAHNLTLLARHQELAVASRPLVVGISRKSFLGKFAADPSLEARLSPALAMSALLRQMGARVFRTHDVAPTVAALRATEALLAG